ncbi:MAG TPA: hypothetical protein VJG32_15090 [Anaerolineae bacterium]|nr:hypothetical protein [Anaerolineae bacterium]
MFKHSIYQFIPPFKRARVLVALLWALGVLFLSIGLHVAQAQDMPANTQPPLVHSIDDPAFV